jgi:hypothetical protein
MDQVQYRKIESAELAVKFAHAGSPRVADGYLQGALGHPFRHSPLPPTFSLAKVYFCISPKATTSITA